MIKQVGNIILIGTSHVSKKSVDEIKKTIEFTKPKVVGIELDIDRLKSLLEEGSNKKKRSSIQMLKQVGVSGYLFGLLAGFVQDKIGKSLGIDPGSDMLAAYKVSRKENIPISLIDINIKYTLKKLSKLSFLRKVSMFSNLIFKSFKKEYREKLNFDVSKGVPDEKFIKNALYIFKKEVPDLYKILIHDRNIYMANKLFELATDPKNNDGYVIGVVGAGHLDGMVEILNKKFENIKNSEHIISPNINSKGNQINLSFKIQV